MRNSWIVLLLSATATMAGAALAPANAHDCTCKFQGGDVAQGETVCIPTAKGKSLARCEMVLNNSSWTILDEPCDVKTSGGEIGLPDQQT